MDHCPAGAGGLGSGRRKIRGGVRVDRRLETGEAAFRETRARNKACRAKKARQSLPCRDHRAGSACLRGCARPAGAALPVARRPGPAAQEMRKRQLHLPIRALRRSPPRAATRPRNGRVNRRLRRRRPPRQAQAGSPQGRHLTGRSRVAPQRLARTAASPTNGFARRSSPNVDIGPCPGTNFTSSPSGNSLSRIEPISVS